MKKIFIFSLLIIFAFSFVSLADAAATKARTASVAQGLQGVYGIADLSSGDSLEIDSSGNAGIALKNGTSQAAIDTSGNIAVEIKNDTNTATVDTNGALLTRISDSTYAYLDNADGVAVTGASKVYSITVTGTNAGDYALVYDALTATGDPEFDIKVGTAADTKTISIPGGVKFNTGVYIDFKDTFQVATVVYDN